jgi:hypothetical protein
LSTGVRSDEGVLITGVYGAGKSTVAAEICYLLEQRRQPYALLDVDFLGWGVPSYDGATGNPFMLRNLAAVVSNYREGGISVFVLAYFVPGQDELRGIREAVGVPLQVVRLTVPLPEIRLHGPARLGQRRDDQVVGVGEQVGHHLVRQGAVEGDGVPVPLVQVVTGHDGRMSGA